MAERKVTRIAIKDRDTDRAIVEVIKAHDEVVRDSILNRRTFVVTLPNATLVKVKHGLGRTFENYFLSAPKGASATGRIVESTPTDGSDDIWLTATGFGATITVRMTVF